MHSIASVSDVMQEIMIYLGPLINPEDKWWDPYADSESTDSRRNQQKNLLNVALACRSFTKPALQAMWWEMDSLLPLFRLIPYMETLGPNAFVLRGRLTKEDFRAFDDYARRIHSLIRASYSDDVPSHLFTQIAQILQRTTLLPNLRYLANPNSPELGFFLNPNLRYLDYTDHCEWDTNAANWISLISLNAPNLRELSICEGNKTSIWQSLGKMTSLMRLAIYEDALLVDEESVRLPSLLPNLLELVVAGVEFSPLYQASLTSPITLENLTSLTINDISIERVLNVLHHFTFPRLTTLILSLSKTTYSSFSSRDKSNLENFCDKAASVTSCLQHISLSVVGWCWKWGKHCPTEGRTSFASFTGLLTLKLINININYPILQHLSLEDLNQVTRAWPGLEVLSLVTHNPPSIGLGALSTIARSLPHLKTLTIGVKLDSTESYPLEHIPVLTHRLESASIMYIGGIRNIPDFCVCFDRTFPLATIKVRGKPYSYTEAQDVQHQLSRLRLAKKDEWKCLELEE